MSATDFFHHGWGKTVYPRVILQNRLREEYRGAESFIHVKNLRYTAVA
jgi:hypothetical protein